MKKKTKVIDTTTPTERSLRRKRQARESGRSRTLLAPDHYRDAVEAERKSFQPFADIVERPGATMLMESMLNTDPKDCPIWKDPTSGLRVHARIVQVNWLTKKKESYRKVTYSPKRFKETIGGIKKHLRETLKTKGLRESTKDKLETLLEGFGDGFDTGSPIGIGGSSGLAMPPGDLTKQIYLNDQWRMMAQSHELYNHNATAHGAVNMMAAFVVGDGVGVKSEDDKVQEVIDEFINRTHFQPRQYTQSVMLSKNGELLWQTSDTLVDGKPGFTEWDSKDPGNCWEIGTELANCKKVNWYYFNYPTRYMIWTKDGTPTSDYIVDVVPAEEMIHVKINVEENEVRGRSDLLSILPLLKMIYDNLRYRNIKVMNAAGILIDRTIEGQDTDVTNVASIQTGFTGAGTEYTHNESEKIQVLKGADSEAAKNGLHEETLGQSGVGIGLPPDYIGGGASGGGRGAALTRTEPAAKLFTSRQVVLETPYRTLFAKVIQNAKKFGRLKPDAPEEVEISFPEVAPENSKDKIGLLNIGLQTRAIDHETYVSMYRTELKITRTYDYDELQQRINVEKQGQLLSLFQAPSVDPDTGTVADKPIGGGAPPVSGSPTPPNGPAGTNKPNPNVQGKTQSAAAMNGDKMGLSNDSRNSIKKSLQAVRGNKKTKSGAHKSLHAGLRSRTKHTIQAETATGPLLRVGAKSLTDESIQAEAEALSKHPSYKELVKHCGEAAPAGWDSTIKKMKGKPGIDNPFALSWWMKGQGYDPAGK